MCVLTTIISGFDGKERECVEGLMSILVTISLTVSLILKFVFRMSKSLLESVRIGTQRNYWGHIEHFVESFVYILTSKNRITQLDSKFSNGIFSYQDKIDESKIFEISDFEKLHEVEHGYCRNNNFPEECPGECRFCEYYLFKPKNIQEGIKWLQDKSDLLEQQLMTETRSLLAIFKNMKFNLITETYSILDQEMALSNANVINRLIRQKAMVDSLLPRSKEVEL